MGGTSLQLEEVLKDNNTHDPTVVSTLKFNNKALFHVSCLREFKNLEKLDLTFNNLTSIEGLKSCINLKWLSVVQNKLETLKGIEGLSKLTVLNAGKNKIKSIDELRSLGSLCALILNDNEIVSICKLEHMKNLNTLVLSRNPIRDIGESLMKVASMKKLSLSNCKLQSIGSSLKSCVELKELRLAHNEITTLPADLINNTRLQNLDLGYNVITRSSDLKVLNSLVNLRNINLQGNPIAENTKFVKKIQSMLPNLQIFNSRPLDKRHKNENGGLMAKNGDEKVKSKKPRAAEDVSEPVDEEDESRDQMTNKKSHSNNKLEIKKKQKKKPNTENRSKLDVIDDPETSFAELFADNDNVGPKKVENKKHLSSHEVTFPSKTKKRKKQERVCQVESSSIIEVGMGGTSTWGDE